MIGVFHLEFDRQNSLPLAASHMWNISQRLENFHVGLMTDTDLFPDV